MTVKFRSLALVFAVPAIVGVVTTRGEAHKAVTSKYTYNDDVFPIVRDHCAPCHAAGGIAPMSLMTYDDAIPWGESIRAELIAEHMPPWNAQEGFGAVKHASALTAHQIDVLLTWATGGNPRGAIDQKLPAVPLHNDWSLGKPDLALRLPAEYTLAADRMEDTHEVTLTTGVTEARWVRAADLLPGTPSIVRSALIYVKGGNDSAGAPAPERVLARWVPGRGLESTYGGTAIRLPAGAELGVRVHYRKTWQFEGMPISDRSTVGLYFAPSNAAQELLTVPLSSGDLPAPGAKDRRLTFSRTLESDVRALAVAPEQVPANISLQVEAVLPNGSRTPMIRLNTRADWDRRYWFVEPITLPKGTKVEVVANFEDPDLMSAAFGAPSPTKETPPASPLRLALNIVPAAAKPSQGNQNR